MKRKPVLFIDEDNHVTTEVMDKELIDKEFVHGQPLKFIDKDELEMTKKILEEIPF